MKLRQAHCLFFEHRLGFSPLHRGERSEAKGMTQVMDPHFAVSVPYIAGSAVKRS